MSRVRVIYSVKPLYVDKKRRWNTHPKAVCIGMCSLARAHAYTGKGRFHRLDVIRIKVVKRKWTYGMGI